MTVVSELVQEVMTALDCQAFFNFAADEGAGKLRLNAYSGISAEEAGNIQWLDYGVAVRGCVVRDGVPIIVGDIPSNPELKTDLIRSYSLQAYASHPLTVRCRLMGTLSFGTKMRTQFSPESLCAMLSCNNWNSYGPKRQPSWAVRTRPAPACSYMS